MLGNENVEALAKQGTTLKDQMDRSTSYREAGGLMEAGQNSQWNAEYPDSSKADAYANKFAQIR